MSTPIQPVPPLVLASEFPSLADRPAGTYNAKAKAWADSENAMVTRARETALVTHNNALAAREAADEAVPAAATAVAARDKALEYRDSAAVIAAAVGSEAGLPSLTGNAGNVLTVGPDADSVSWEPLPRAFSTGDVMLSAGELPSPEWLPCDGSIYLKDSYPDLASQLGSLYPGRVWSKEQDYSLITPNNTSFTALQGVGVGNGRIVVSMNNTAPNPRVVFSDDGGLSWTSATDTSTLTVIGGGVLYINGKFFIFSSSELTVSDDGDIWGTPVSLSGVQDITYGNGVYVAVGYSSGNPVIYSSTNTTSWASRTSGFGTSVIYSAAFGNGKFVAVGADGKIATSADGTNWAQRTSGTSSAIRCVAFGNGKFVALANGGVALTSVDGESWSLHSYSPNTITPQEMFFSSGVFYARFSSGLILKSSDGTNWIAASPFPTYNLTRVAVDEERLYFVAINQDSNYTLLALKKSLIGEVDIYGSASDGTTQALVGYAAASSYPCGLVVTRTKTTGWEPRIIPAWANIKINAITFGDGNWVAVGDGGKIFTSSDTISWQEQTSGVTANLTAVTYGDGQFVAVGLIDSSATTILTSADGLTWVRRTTPPEQRNLRDIGYGNGQFVAVGDQQAANPTLLISSNGSDWRFITSGIPTSTNFNCVGFFDGQFVVGGNSGTIITSGDGVFWSLRPTPFAGNIFALAYGNGVCVAVGASGTVLVSDDFINWSTRFAAQVGTLNTASFFNDEFYAAGLAGGRALGNTAYDKTTQFSVPALGNPTVRGYIKTGVQ